MSTTTRSTTSSTTSSTTPPVAADAPVGIEELEQAWRAVRAGRFRPDRHRSGDNSGLVCGPDIISGPLVVVAGAHGWSGTSTTALLIADAVTRRGVRARVVDAAAPARSGFAAAAATEYGVDDSGVWRLGSRGGVSLQRLAHPVRRPDGIPVPLPTEEGTLTVVDAGWPITDLLDHLQGGEGRHWLTALLRSAQLVLTARATVPGLRHAEATLQVLDAPGRRIALALVGPRTLPRWLMASAGAAVLTVQREGFLVTVPDRPHLSGAGLTPAPLPRQLHPTGDRLLNLTHPHDQPETPPQRRPKKYLIPHLNPHRKDDRR